MLNSLTLNINFGNSEWLTCQVGHDIISQGILCSLKNAVFSDLGHRLKKRLMSLNIAEKGEKMKIKLLGGCQVGASAAENIFVDGEGKARCLLYDGGVVPGTRRPHLDPSGSVDAVVVSHAHDDHIGHIPITHYSNPEASLWMTRPTVYFSRINWINTHDILMMESKHGKKDKRSVTEFLGQFSEGLENASQNLNIIEEPGRIEIFPGVFMYSGSSGHLPGAMWTMFEFVPEGRVVVYSGDITFQDRPTVRGTILSEFPQKKIDLLFLDSTNGARDIPQLMGEEIKMAEEVRQDLAEGRTVVSAMLSLGRLPDLVVFLAERGIDSYVDGQGRITLPETLGGDGKWSHTVDIPYEEEEPSSQNGGFYSFKIGAGRVKIIENNDQRERLINSPGAKHIAAPSGMLVGGRSVQYFGIFLKDSSARVNLTSYQGEGTPGSSLEHKIKTGGTLSLRDHEGEEFEVPIKALVRKYNFSSHAGASEDIAMVKYLAPVRTMLVHGETQGRNDLKARLAESGYFEAHVPKDGDEIEV